jgi:predicted porin
MKKAALIAGLIAGSPNVYAQSQVTLAGTVDSGLVFTQNAGGHHQFQLGSGVERSNKLIFSGIEELGGGLAAVFNLENSFSTSNGTIAQAGTFFGHQAYVGLRNSFGVLTFGRQISDTAPSVGSMSAGGSWAAAGAGYGNHFGDIDDLDTLNRINNAIKFQSAKFSGLTVNGVFSPGGQAGDFAKNRIWDLSSVYLNGPFRVGVGYLNINSPNHSFWGNNANSSPTNSNILNPIFSGYGTARTQQVISAGASYAIGKATVGLVYSNTQFKSLGSVNVAGLSAAAKSAGGNASVNVAEANVRYQITPYLILGTAYFYGRDSGTNTREGAHYQQVDVGAIYSLSTRTSLYLIGIGQIAAGTNSLGVPAVAAISATTPSSTNHQVVITTGISHLF